MSMLSNTYNIKLHTKKRCYENIYYGIILLSIYLQQNHTMPVDYHVFAMERK